MLFVICTCSNIGEPIINIKFPVTCTFYAAWFPLVSRKPKYPRLSEGSIPCFRTHRVTGSARLGDRGLAVSRVKRREPPKLFSPFFTSGRWCGSRAAAKLYVDVARAYSIPRLYLETLRGCFLRSPWGGLSPLGPYFFLFVFLSLSLFFKFLLFIYFFFFFLFMPTLPFCALFFPYAPVHPSESIEVSRHPRPKQTPKSRHWKTVKYKS